MNSAPQTHSGSHPYLPPSAEAWWGGGLWSHMMNMTMNTMTLSWMRKLQKMNDSVAMLYMCSLDTWWFLVLNFIPLYQKPKVKTVDISTRHMRICTADKMW